MKYYTLIFLSNIVHFWNKVLHSTLRLIASRLNFLNGYVDLSHSNNYLWLASEHMVVNFFTFSNSLSHFQRVLLYSKLRRMSPAPRLSLPASTKLNNFDMYIHWGPRAENSFTSSYLHSFEYTVTRTVLPRINASHKRDCRSFAEVRTTDNVSKRQRFH